MDVTYHTLAANLKLRFPHATAEKYKPFFEFETSF
jgi:hypothetical protein